MGRPYLDELTRLPATIRWALHEDVTALRATLLRELGGHNLVAIGSGGSLTAAWFAALLHETVTGRLARAATPLEAVTRAPLRDTGALLLSARGTNTDIRRAAELLPMLGYEAVSAVTTREGSPLSRILNAYGSTTHEFTVPGGRDGFLATNSLMATLVLMYRAALPANDSEVGEDLSLAHSKPVITGSERALRNRTVVVMAQTWATPAAVDFESRFSEAALANVTVTDPRNFAHGRHHWLSRYAASTGVVSLETKSSVRDARRVLRLLPPDIDVLRVTSERDGPDATIELVGAVMGFAGAVAQARGIDPGRPSVAEFGRRLYRANATPSLASPEAASIAKKRRALFLGPQSDRDRLSTALFRFTSRLERTPFTGLAVDYDGTLCANDRRTEPIEPDIQFELRRLLNHGILLGVASGRGGSVREALRSALEPHHWNRVVVGLYNGAKVVGLSDQTPRSEEQTPDSLAAAYSRMRPLEKVLGFEAVPRPHQVSLRPHDVLDPLELRSITIEQLAGIRGLSVVASSHSVDILLAGTSKTAVVDALRSMRPGCILRIGDQGAAGGNDFELLNTGPSLSVDRVSSNLDTCWNLGPPGVSGPPLTTQYLRALRLNEDGFRVDTSSLLGNVNGRDK